MGKYMRKCGGAAGGGRAAPAVVEHRAPVALGVRTRSRAAALDDARGKGKRTAAASTAVEDALLGRDGGGDAAAGCYKQLRSRRLFMPASAKVEELRGQRADEAEASTAKLADSGRSVETEVVAGVSRCSSTASTAADVADSERSGDDAEVRESRDVESSVSDSECGGRRERRETTPSSRSPVDSSDPELESSKATDEQKRKSRRCPATTAAFHLGLETRPRTPPAAEIDEFFAAAEKAQAVRFAAKYNFDVARGVPLNAGRFEWTPVASTV